MAKFAVLGYGVVGSGVVELFYKNKEKIEKKAGHEMDVKFILDIREFPDSPYKDKFVKTIDEIVADSEITTVAECMGGVEPAFTFTKKCLEKGISVCTSNKELVAAKGDELLALAQANECNYFFEASVGG
ncbi:MAG: homoserine dehydrogenase, partial [Oscillospiraceae bacterium]|nr:homoserine dehydrogenase [Oscillospiraceae bacterium]